ncbi:pentatricopeptide repeat-containing protein 2-like isoform X8 [Daktulosphaira vitifoliae]|uniref:pentatricopeptide repeat-containing protein 2-like isoform X8 n=1 Tax=Daktulosphaira vitifoliae TaxID=58002 RepID=UPI0021AAC480|nr:pentatricopeptide repeat-containing protein 2-like isoform X8 [Daktulosphaira vitifoliae]
MRLLHTYCLFFCFYFIKPSVSTIPKRKLWQNVGYKIHLTNEILEKVITKEIFYKKFNSYIKYVTRDLSYISKLNNADKNLSIDDVNENCKEKNDKNIDIKNCKDIKEYNMDYMCNIDINVEFFNDAVKKRNDIMKRMFNDYLHIINKKQLCNNEKEISKVCDLIKALENNHPNNLKNSKHKDDIISNSSALCD